MLELSTAVSHLVQDLSYIRALRTRFGFSRIEEMAVNADPVEIPIFRNVPLGMNSGDFIEDIYEEGIDVNDVRLSRFVLDVALAEVMRGACGACRAVARCAVQRVLTAILRDLRDASPCPSKGTQPASRQQLQRRERSLPLAESRGVVSSFTSCSIAPCERSPASRPSTSEDQRPLDAASDRTCLSAEALLQHGRRLAREAADQIRGQICRGCAERAEQRVRALERAWLALVVRSFRPGSNASLSTFPEDPHDSDGQSHHPYYLMQQKIVQSEYEMAWQGCGPSPELGAHPSREREVYQRLATLWVHGLPTSLDRVVAVYMQASAPSVCRSCSPRLWHALCEAWPALEAARSVAWETSAPAGWLDLLEAAARRAESLISAAAAAGSGADGGWCPACTPAVARLAAAFGDDARVTVLREAVASAFATQAVDGSASASGSAGVESRGARGTMAVAPPPPNTAAMTFEDEHQHFGETEIETEVQPEWDSTCPTCQHDLLRFAGFMRSLVTDAEARRQQGAPPALSGLAGLGDAFLQQVVEEAASLAPRHRSISPSSLHIPPPHQHPPHPPHSPHPPYSPYPPPSPPASPLPFPYPTPHQHQHPVTRKLPPSYFPFPLTPPNTPPNQMGIPPGVPAYAPPGPPPGTLTTKQAHAPSTECPDSSTYGVQGWGVSPFGEPWSAESGVSSMPLFSSEHFSSKLSSVPLHQLSKADEGYSSLAAAPSYLYSTSYSEKESSMCPIAMQTWNAQMECCKKGSLRTARPRSLPPIDSGANIPLQCRISASSLPTDRNRCTRCQVKMPPPAQSAPPVTEGVRGLFPEEAAAPTRAHTAPSPGYPTRCERHACRGRAVPRTPAGARNRHMTASSTPSEHTTASSLPSSPLESLEVAETMVQSMKELLTSMGEQTCEAIDAVNRSHRSLIRAVCSPSPSRAESPVPTTLSVLAALLDTRASPDIMVSIDSRTSPNVRTSPHPGALPNPGDSPNPMTSSDPGNSPDFRVSPDSGASHNPATSPHPGASHNPASSPDPEASPHLAKESDEVKGAAEDSSRSRPPDAVAPTSAPAPAPHPASTHPLEAGHGEMRCAASAADDNASGEPAPTPFSWTAFTLKLKSQSNTEPSPFSTPVRTRKEPRERGGGLPPHHYSYIFDDHPSRQDTAGEYTCTSIEEEDESSIDDPPPGSIFPRERPFYREKIPNIQQVNFVQTTTAGASNENRDSDILTTTDDEPTEKIHEAQTREASIQQLSSIMRGGPDSVSEAHAQQDGTSIRPSSADGPDSLKVSEEGRGSPLKEAHRGCGPKRRCGRLMPKAEGDSSNLNQERKEGQDMKVKAHENEEKAPLPICAAPPAQQQEVVNTNNAAVATSTCVSQTNEASTPSLCPHATPKNIQPMEKSPRETDGVYSSLVPSTRPELSSGDKTATSVVPVSHSHVGEDRLSTSHSLVSSSEPSTFTHNHHYFYPPNIYQNQSQFRVQPAPLLQTQEVGLPQRFTPFNIEVASNYHSPTIHQHQVARILPLPPPEVIQPTYITPYTLVTTSPHPQVTVFDPQKWERLSSNVQTVTNRLCDFVHTPRTYVSSQPPTAQRQWEQIRSEALEVARAVLIASEQSTGLNSTARFDESAWERIKEDAEAVATAAMLARQQQTIPKRHIVAAKQVQFVNEPLMVAQGPPIQPHTVYQPAPGSSIQETPQVYPTLMSEYAAARSPSILVDQNASTNILYWRTPSLTPELSGPIQPTEPRDLEEQPPAKFQCPPYSACSTLPHRSSCSYEEPPQSPCGSPPPTPPTTGFYELSSVSCIIPEEEPSVPIVQPPVEKPRSPCRRPVAVDSRRMCRPEDVRNTHQVEPLEELPAALSAGNRSKQEYNVISYASSQIESSIEDETLDTENLNEVSATSAIESANAIFSEDKFTRPCKETSCIKNHCFHSSCEVYSEKIYSSSSPLQDVTSEQEHVHNTQSVINTSEGDRRTEIRLKLFQQAGLIPMRVEDNLPSRNDISTKKVMPTHVSQPNFQSPSSFHTSGGMSSTSCSPINEKPQKKTSEVRKLRLASFRPEYCTDGSPRQNVYRTFQLKSIIDENISESAVEEPSPGSSCQHRQVPTDTDCKENTFPSNFTMGYVLTPALVNNCNSPQVALKLEDYSYLLPASPGHTAAPNLMMEMQPLGHTMACTTEMLLNQRLNTEQQAVQTESATYVRGFLSPITGSPITLSPSLTPTNTGSPSAGSPRMQSPSRGSPSAGSPSRDSPNCRSSSRVSPSYGSPSRGSHSRDSLSRESPSRGSPSRGSPSRGSPSRCSPSRGSPSRGSLSHDSLSHESPSRLSPGRCSPDRCSSGRCSGGHCLPGRCSPGRCSPIRGSLSHGSPIRGSPRHGSLSRGSFSRGSPNLGSPSRESPSRESPSRESPSRESPSRESPSRGSPSRGSPSRGSPSHGSPSRGSPSRESPSRRSLSYGSPNHRSPSYGTPSRDSASRDSPCIGSLRIGTSNASSAAFCTPLSSHSLFSHRSTGVSSSAAPPAITDSNFSFVSDMNSSRHRLRSSSTSATSLLGTRHTASLPASPRTSGHNLNEHNISRIAKSSSNVPTKAKCIEPTTYASSNNSGVANEIPSVPLEAKPGAIDRARLCLKMACLPADFVMTKSSSMVDTESRSSIGALNTRNAETELPSPIPNADMSSVFEENERFLPDEYSTPNKEYRESRESAAEKIGVKNKRREFVNICSSMMRNLKAHLELISSAAEFAQMLVEGIGHVKPSISKHYSRAKSQKRQRAPHSRDLKAKKRLKKDTTSIDRLQKDIISAMQSVANSFTQREMKKHEIARATSTSTYESKHMIKKGASSTGDVPAVSSFRTSISDYDTENVSEKHESPKKRPQSATTSSESSMGVSHWGELPSRKRQGRRLEREDHEATATPSDKMDSTAVVEQPLAEESSGTEGEEADGKEGGSDVCRSCVEEKEKSLPCESVVNTDSCVPETSFNRPETPAVTPATVENNAVNIGHSSMSSVKTISQSSVSTTENTRVSHLESMESFRRRVAAVRNHDFPHSRDPSTPSHDASVTCFGDSDSALDVPTDSHNVPSPDAPHFLLKAAIHTLADSNASVRPTASTESVLEGTASVMSEGVQNYNRSMDSIRGRPQQRHSVGNCGAGAGHTTNKNTSRAFRGSRGLYFRTSTSSGSESVSSHYKFPSSSPTTDKDDTSQENIRRRKKTKSERSSKNIRPLLRKFARATSSAENINSCASCQICGYTIDTRKKVSFLSTTMTEMYDLKEASSSGNEGSVGKVNTISPQPSNLSSPYKLSPKSSLRMSGKYSSPPQKPLDTKSTTPNQEKASLVTRVCDNVQSRGSLGSVKSLKLSTSYTIQNKSKDNNCNAAAKVSQEREIGSFVHSSVETRRTGSRIHDCVSRSSSGNSSMTVHNKCSKANNRLALKDSSNSVKEISDTSCSTVLNQQACITPNSSVLSIGRASGRGKPTVRNDVTSSKITSLNRYRTSTKLLETDQRGKKFVPSRETSLTRKFPLNNKVQPTRTVESSKPSSTQGSIFNTPENDGKTTNSANKSVLVPQNICEVEGKKSSSHNLPFNRRSRVLKETNKSPSVGKCDNSTYSVKDTVCNIRYFQHKRTSIPDVVALSEASIRKHNAHPENPPSTNGNQSQGSRMDSTQQAATESKTIIRSNQKCSTDRLHGPQISDKSITSNLGVSTSRKLSEKSCKMDKYPKITPGETITSKMRESRVKLLIHARNESGKQNVDPQAVSLHRQPNSGDIKNHNLQRSLTFCRDKPRSITRSNSNVSNPAKDTTTHPFRKYVTMQTNNIQEGTLKTAPNSNVRVYEKSGIASTNTEPLPTPEVCTVMSDRKTLRDEELSLLPIFESEIEQRSRGAIFLDPNNIEQNQQYFSEPIKCEYNFLNEERSPDPTTTASFNESIKCIVCLSCSPKVCSPNVCSPNVCSPKVCSLNAQPQTSFTIVRKSLLEQIVSQEASRSTIVKEIEIASEEMDNNSVDWPSKESKPNDALEAETSDSKSSTAIKQPYTTSTNLVGKELSDTIPLSYEINKLPQDILKSPHSEDLVEINIPENTDKKLSNALEITSSETHLPLECDYKLEESLRGSISNNCITSQSNTSLTKRLTLSSNVLDSQSNVSQVTFASCLGNSSSAICDTGSPYVAEEEINKNVTSDPCVGSGTVATQGSYSEFLTDTFSICNLNSPVPISRRDQKHWPHVFDVLGSFTKKAAYQVVKPVFESWKRVLKTKNIKYGVFQRPYRISRTNKYSPLIRSFRNRMNITPTSSRRAARTLPFLSSLSQNRDVMASLMPPRPVSVPPSLFPPTPPSSSTQASRSEGTVEMTEQKLKMRKAPLTSKILSLSSTTTQPPSTRPSRLKSPTPSTASRQMSRTSATIWLSQNTDDTPDEEEPWGVYAVSRSSSPASSIYFDAAELDDEELPD